MKTILLITHSSASAGGAEGEFTRLLYRLKKNYKVYMIIPDGPKANLYEKTADKSVIIPQRVFQLNPDSIKEYIRFIITGIVKLFKIFPFVFKNRKTIDVCFANSSVCFVELIPVILFKIKYVLSVKEIIEPDFVRKFLFSVYFKTASKIIVISEAVKRKIIRKKYENLIEKIFSSIDDSKYLLAKKNYKSEIIGGNDKFIVLNIGAFYKLKGQHVLLEAAKKFSIKDNVEIVFIGKIVDHAYFKLCREIANQCEIKNKIKFFGEKTQDETIYEILKSHCLAVCSSREGFSLILLEGMLLEKPVIATNVGVISETVVNSQNGIVYNYGDAYTLHNSILKLKNDKTFYKKIQSEGRNTYSQLFNGDLALDKIENTLQKVSNQ